MAKRGARASKKSKVHRWTSETAREASRKGHAARWGGEKNGKKNSEAA